MASVLVMLRRREEDSGENYLNGSLGENSVLFQETLDVFVLGDLKESDSFDGGHFVSFCLRISRRFRYRRSSWVLLQR